MAYRVFYQPKMHLTGAILVLWLCLACTFVVEAQETNTLAGVTTEMVENLTTLLPESSSESHSPTTTSASLPPIPASTMASSSSPLLTTTTELPATTFSSTESAPSSSFEPTTVTTTPASSSTTVPITSASSSTTMEVSSSNQSTSTEASSPAPLQVGSKREEKADSTFSNKTPVGQEKPLPDLTSSPTVEPCENVLCGRGAECKDGKCRCTVGRIGDPNDLLGTGCVKADLALPKNGTEGRVSRIENATEEVVIPAAAKPMDQRVSSATTGVTSDSPGATFSAKPSSSASLELKPEQGLHKLTLVKRTPTSIQVEWEPFNAANQPDAHGLAIQYRELNETNWRRVDLDDHDTTEMTISKLKPNTEYRVRISLIQDMTTKLLGAQTETIIASTSAGCLRNGTARSIGEGFEEGCEKCSCKPNGEIECSPRCEMPYFRKGHTVDPLCFERSIDDCCALVICASEAAQDATEDMDPCERMLCGPNSECTSMANASEPKCVCKLGFAGNPSDIMIGCTPDAATNLTKASKSDNGCVMNNQTHMPGEKFFDGCVFACECSLESEINCKPRCPPPVETTDANCVSVPDPADSCCQMLACNGLPRPAATENGCTFKNNTYKPNETFFEGCEGKCVCLGFGDVQCVPRCPQRASPLGSNCKLGPDPADACCTMPVCEETNNGTSLVVLNENLPLTTMEPMLDTSSTTMPNRTNAGRREDEMLDAPNTLFSEVPRPQEGPISVQISHLSVVNSSTLALHVILSEAAVARLSERGFLRILRSTDLTEWQEVDVTPTQVQSEGNSNTTVTVMLGQLKPNTEYFVQIQAGSFTSNTLNVQTRTAEEEPASRQGSVTTTTTTTPSSTTPVRSEQPTCSFNGTLYQEGQEFFQGCHAYCVCMKGKAECSAIECPSSFGLDVLNPRCTEWEQPNESIREPPNCCVQPVCKNDGSCMYKGEKYDNFAEIPSTASGCEQRCMCEFGNISCESRCAPVPAFPPNNLPCPPSEAELGQPIGEPCCTVWRCSTNGTAVGGFRPNGNDPFGSVGPNHGSETIGDLQAEVLGPRSIMVKFRIPNVYVGLKAFVEILYNNAENIVPETAWESQSFEEALLASAQQEFLVSNLMPNTDYTMKVNLHLLLGDAANPPTSAYIRARTAGTMPSMESTTTLPPKITVDAELRQVEAGPNSITVGWRAFNEFERRFIDGVQLRYKNLDNNAQVFTMTHLLHRDVTSYQIEGLQVNTTYEVDIIFMPFTNQSTELISLSPINIKTTDVEKDRYNFEIELAANSVLERSAELNWTGVPYPEDRLINIYRILYRSDSEPDFSSTFKLAKHDSPSTLLIKDLKPGTKYHMWLEAYLTNGRVKKTSVIEVRTQPGDNMLKTNEIEPVGTQESRTAVDDKGPNYYSALVGVAIVAGVAVLLVLILLIVIIRRQNKAKATITARKSQSAYDNPTYKQNYDAEANGHSRKPIEP